MSKSKGNIVDPWDHFNREGADATRWYMVTAGAPWNPLKFDPNGVRETYGKMFLTLWNIYRFHSDYAALDGFDPETSPKGKNTPLDDWVLSRLAEVVAEQISNSKIGISTRHAEISKNSSLMMFPIGMLEGLDADFGKRPTAMTNWLASTHCTRYW